MLHVWSNDTNWTIVNKVMTEDCYFLLDYLRPPQNACQVRVDHIRLQLALWRVKSNSWLRRRDIRGIKTTRPWVLLNCVAFECFWCFLPCIDVFHCFSSSRTMWLKYIEILIRSSKYWQDMQTICGWSWKAESWVMLSQYAQPFSCKLTNPSWQSEFGSWLRLKTRMQAFRHGLAGVKICSWTFVNSARVERCWRLDWFESGHCLVILSGGAAALFTCVGCWMNFIEFPSILQHCGSWAVHWVYLAAEDCR